MRGKQVKVQLSVSPQLEKAIRRFLSDQGLAKKGGLSTFFADLARERISVWVRDRAAAAGRADELTPERVAAAVERLLSEPAKPAEAKGEGTAGKRATSFSDYELDALTSSVASWGELRVD